jgi:hypothetical protein
MDVPVFRTQTQVVDISRRATHKQGVLRNSSRLISAAGSINLIIREMRLPRRTEKMTNNTNIQEFWTWFQGIATSLTTDVENRDLLEELDRRLHQLDSRLSWEVGPGAVETWQLVVSPNLERDLRPRAQEIICQAPVIQGWEFHAARRPKDWDYKLLMERPDGTEPVQLDVSGWGFVLLRYPDGNYEILLQGNNISLLDNDERWQAAALTLESILGEEVLLDKIKEFELVDQLDSRFAEKRKPIQSLRETVQGA